MPEMSEPMSEERLAEIERRCEAATPGPWLEHEWDTDGNMKPFRPRDQGWLKIGDGKETVIQDMDISMGEHDAAFVMHSRTDIPALLAEVRRLRALCEHHHIDPDQKGKPSTSGR